VSISVVAWLVLRVFVEAALARTVWGSLNVGVNAKAIVAARIAKARFEVVIMIDAPVRDT